MPEIVGRLRTPRLPSAPASPVVGEMYYDTTTNQLLYWNGTSWISGSAGGGADLVYNGQFPTGGPNYTDGDIVIGSDGVAYLCVQSTNAAPVSWSGISGPVGPPGPQGAQGPAGIQGPSGAGVPTVQNNKWLRGSGGAAVWSTIDVNDVTNGKPTYGLAANLPASPVDGQEYILVDSLTNPSYMWRFRYNASSTSPYKWEYVGGVPATSAVDTAENLTMAAGTYTDLATVGPQFAVPRAGEYDCSIAIWLVIGAATGWVNLSSALALNVSGTWFGSPSICQIFASTYPQAGINYTNGFYSARGPITVSGTNLKMMYTIVSQSGTGAPQIGRRRLFVTPVRIS